MDTPRVAFLRDKYQTEVFKAFKEREGILIDWSNPPDTAEGVFDAFVEADPTRNGAYLEWMLRRYVQGVARPSEDGEDREIRDYPKFEDLARLKDTLNAFDAYKGRLPPAERDINRYPGEHAVWAAIQPHLPRAGADEADDVSSKERKRQVKDQAISESDVLFSGDGWMLAIPRTKDAAIWWGLGTRWCTAATKTRNYFDTYSGSGPLFTVSAPGGKFQFHVETGECKAADDSDIAIDKVLAGAPEGLWDALAPMMQPRLAASDRRKWVTRLPVRWLEPVWDSFPDIVLKKLSTEWKERVATLTDDFLMRAVKPKESSGNLLAKVPVDRRSKEICLAAVSAHAGSLKSVPVGLRSYEMFLSASNAPDWSLDMVEQFAPETVTAEQRGAIYRRTIAQKPQMLGDVPPSFIDDGMLEDGMRKFHPAFWITTLPAAHWGSSDVWIDIYRMLLSRNPEHFQSIPAKVREGHPELFSIAVTAQPSIFERLKASVPPEWHAEAIETALASTKRALWELREYATPERVLYALAHQPTAIYEAYLLGYTDRQFVVRALEAADTTDKAHEVVWQVQWKRFSEDKELYDLAWAKLSKDDRWVLERQVAEIGATWEQTWLSA